MCYSCSIKIGQASDLKSGVTGIALDGVMNDRFPALLSWAWCINPDKVKAEFKAKAGLDISESNLVTIVKAHTLGNDIKNYKVNFLEVVRGIKSFTQPEIDNSSCKLMLIQP